MKYKVALVDDHAEIINQLATELNALNGVEIIFTAVNGADFLLQMEHLPLNEHPQVVIMDIEMPVMGGIDAIKICSRRYSDVQYIMFTVSDDDGKLFDAIKAGADGYLLKHEQASTIFESIKEVIEKNGAPMSPSIARKTLKLLSKETNDNNTHHTTNALSDREVEILKNMVAGLNYKQIGDKLFLSPFTVRNHIAKIYSKLHITSKTQAVTMAIKNKWI